MGEAGSPNGARGRHGMGHRAASQGRRVANPHNQTGVVLKLKGGEHYFSSLLNENVDDYGPPNRNHYLWPNRYRSA